MNKTALSLLVYLSLCFFASGADSQITAEVKKKLLAEVAGFQQDLLQADQQIYKLQQDNNAIIVKLQNMESWGLLQQEEKESYYQQVLEAENNWAEAKATIDLEKMKQKQLADKYDRIKRIFCLLAGSCAALLFLKFEKLLQPILTSLAGPWVLLTPFIGVSVCFSVGYGVAYFFL
jgi:hypothetical protein